MYAIAYQWGELWANNWRDNCDMTDWVWFMKTSRARVRLQATDCFVRDHWNIKLNNVDAIAMASHFLLLQFAVGFCVARQSFKSMHPIQFTLLIGMRLALCCSNRCSAEWFIRLWATPLNCLNGQTSSSNSNCFSRSDFATIPPYFGQPFGCQFLWSRVVRSVLCSSVHLISFIVVCFAVCISKTTGARLFCLFKNHTSESGGVRCFWMLFNIYIRTYMSSSWCVCVLAIYNTNCARTAISRAQYALTRSHFV